MIDFLLQNMGLLIFCSSLCMCECACCVMNCSWTVSLLYRATWRNVALSWNSTKWFLRSFLCMVIRYSNWMHCKDQILRAGKTSEHNQQFLQNTTEWCLALFSGRFWFKWVNNSCLKFFFCFLFFGLSCTYFSVGLVWNIFECSSSLEEFF